jgi:hypothetical protein
MKSDDCLSEMSCNFNYVVLRADNEESAAQTLQIRPTKSWQKVGKKLAKSWQKRCHILVSGLHCLTYSALNDLISIKSGTGVGGQKVLSRPSADSFAVGRRQKGHLHNPVKNNNRPRSDQLRQYREVEKILGIIQTLGKN